MLSKFLLLILVCSFFQIDLITAPPENQPVNAVLGDVSFVDEFGRLPNKGDSETLRITTHLKYVTHLLESSDVSYLSASQLKNRQHLISLLKTYTAGNSFPINYEYLNERRPTFIDKHGNICAVGYLVQQTVGQEVAETINSTFKYEYLMEMDSELLDGWLAEYGLTKKEAAMIQPTYGPRPGEEQTIKFNSVETRYSISSALLAGSQLAFTSLTFNNEDSYRKKSFMAYTSIGLGAISLVTGIYQLDQSTNTYKSFFGGTIKEINVSKRNLSITNIAFGSASVAFNTYRAFQLKKEKERKSFALTPSMQYLTGLSEPVPTANLYIRF